MPITRNTTRVIARAEADDLGNVTVAVIGSIFAATQTITPAEARELAAEITAAADEADAYRAEQADAA
ncbi:hypothetical protein [Microbacterium sp. PA5]|uniref:hypothetical protein n=1 Tax=Microbacterium sp. PA5 TaxID=3416654 RepID=UPI003CE9103B